MKRKEHPLSVKNNITNLLTTEDLIAACMSSFKQNMISKQSRPFRKSRLDSARHFFVKKRNAHPSYVEENVTESLTAEDLVAACMSAMKQNMTSHQWVTQKWSRLEICRDFLQRDDRSSLPKKTNKLLTAEGLVATCMTSLKQIMTISQTRTGKMSRLDSALHFLVKKRNEHPSPVEK
jgi:YesN/AraC family two-component response regulator